MNAFPWISLSRAAALAVGPIAVVLVAFALVAPAIAEPEAGPPPGPPPHDHPRPPHDHPRPPHDHPRPPHDPLRRALDANGDREISSDEMANAASALKSLDKNGDGKLDREEMRPPMPPGMHHRHGSGDRDHGDRERSERDRSERDAFRGPPGPDGPGAEGPRPEMFVDRLMEFDADTDGKLDRSELMVAAETMAARRREFMEKMGRWMGDRRRP